ncbi:YqgE/AlgH family protein [Pseudoalteromonas denitrificans]|uniref:Putative transcriptional regulator n=1 Tax=Pseudoalteromonas denitrificans DSM 6059 TaxID=1123010 RepID=A0A1I1V2Y6_9GAMM|nr:YqgE/AlgH family protein [Pseudoalteromonas denitrificans]SFD77412.1 putative transcriptional regulator [Pseudoalteromonas denitrificans DSM 6059]
MFGFKKRKQNEQTIQDNTTPESISLTDTLLITHPLANVVENSFRYSVIYLVEHNTDGAVGVNLSNASHNQLKDMPLDSGSIMPNWLENRNLLKGGPVKSDDVWLLEPTVNQQGLHHFKNSNLALSYYQKHLQRILQINTPQPVQIGTGSCGWKAGQLEDEIQRGHWLILPAIDELIFQGSWSYLYMNAYETYEAHVS